MRALDPRQAPGPHLHLVPAQVWWWEPAHALRAVRQFAWLKAGSSKAALSRPGRASGWYPIPLESGVIIKPRVAVEL